MDEDTLRYERVVRKAQERARSTNAACFICGERNPICFQSHHLSGQRFGEEQKHICLNCHAILTRLQLDHPKPIWDPPDELERLAHALLNEADLFLVLSKVRRKQGLMLIERVRSDVPFTKDGESGDDAP